MTPSEEKLSVPKDVVSRQLERIERVERKLDQSGAEKEQAIVSS